MRGKNLSKTKLVVLSRKPSRIRLVEQSRIKTVATSRPQPTEQSKTRPVATSKKPNRNGHGCKLLNVPNNSRLNAIRLKELKKNLSATLLNERKRTDKRQLRKSKKHLPNKADQADFEIDPHRKGSSSCRVGKNELWRVCHPPFFKICH